MAVIPYIWGLLTVPCGITSRDCFFKSLQRKRGPISKRPLFAILQLMSKRRPKFIIIDGNAIVHRAFHALPPLSTKDGTIVNALYGFLNILFKVIKDLKPEYVAVTFDVKGSTFRHEQFKEYKATRKKQPDELYAQIPMIREAVKAFGFAQYEMSGFEADDIIGTITAKIPKGIDSYIVTGDMDTLQLVDDHTFVFTMRKGVSDTMTYDADAVSEKFQGLKVDQMIDYKALRGDPSDNIPGVRGIGEKGAINLLQEYGTVENVFKNVDKITGAIQKKLLASEAEAMMSKSLATIKRDVPIEFVLEDTKVREYDRDAVIGIIQKYELKSLLKQLPELDHTPATKQLSVFDAPVATKTELTPEAYLENSNYELIDTKSKAENLLIELSKQSVFAFDTETTSLDPLQCELVGFSISWKSGTGYYIIGELIQIFKNILENPKILKIGHNIKFDIKVLQATSQVFVADNVYDTMLASYVLNPGTRGHSLDTLALVEFGYQMMPYEELVGKGKKEILITEVPLDKLAFYAAEDADYTWRLYEVMQPRVVEEKLDTVLQMELDLIPVLVDMETAGIMVNVQYLKTMSLSLKKDIHALEKKIYKQAGTEFNIASPLQLKEILFEKLKITSEGIKKTKTGISTAASELEKMRGLHPIIDLISDYREVTKLQSTYVEALPRLVNPKTKRIHTNYNQTIAATGRLSSTDPNLQNIPIRTELGRKIRKAFVAPKGKVLLSLDYSQVELRIVAHMVDDKKFIEAFKSGADIHARTAAEIHGVDESKVTKEMRRAAKSVNFGILYGMGTYGLARDAGMSYEEAKNYLEVYFKNHPAIKNYIESTKELVRKTGYAESLFGRKRFLPDINSGMPVVRAAAERAAINMPVQGTAADLMKMAMLHVAAALDTKKIDAVMLLQVHDELVFEVAESKAKTQAKIIKDIMESVYELQVPLVVDVGIGTNWMELEDLEV